MRLEITPDLPGFLAAGATRSSREASAKLGRPLRSQPPEPTGTHSWASRRSVWSLLESGTTASVGPSQPITSTGRSFPWLGSSS